MSLGPSPEINPMRELLLGLANGIEGKVGGYNPTDYENDPVGWTMGILGEAHIYAKLAEVFNSVRDNQYTAVMSANGVGKTWAAARIGAWWLNVFRENCKVITTAAPPERQIKELVWGEIHSVFHEAKQRGVVLVGNDPGVMSWSVGPQWWMKGFTIPQTGTSQERIARFQGHHAEHLLFIVDEAHGVPAEIFDAIDRCMTGSHNHLLLLSNPLAPSGPFYDAVKDPKFNVISISAFDHPNVQTGEEVIPGCVTRQVTEDRIRKWSIPLPKAESEDAACFRVPEYFPDDIAGTVRKVTHFNLETITLSRFPVQGDDALIPITLIQAAAARWTDAPPADAPAGIGGLDVAEMGVDSNCFIERRGCWASKPVRWNGVDVIRTGNEAAVLARKREVAFVGVDAIGVGSGVGPHLRELKVEALDIKISESPTMEIDDRQFNILRDQLYWAIREWLRTDPNSMLPPDPQLLQELSILKYDINFRGKVVVMHKDRIKELIGRSPDATDALALTFYVKPMWSTLEFVSV